MNATEPNRADWFTVLPILDQDNTALWTSGRDGILTITGCTDCGRYIHPPASVCRYCYSRAVEPRPVSGRGTLYSYSVNVQDWGKGELDRYVFAIVELAEQPGLRLSSHLIDCAPHDITIGMDVAVDFVAVEDVWMPVFRPAARS